MIKSHSTAPRGAWQRVSQSRPCPVCGKSDWCLFAGPADDPIAVICARVESTKPVGTKGAGWLHCLRHEPFRPERRKVTVSTPTPSLVDFDAMAGACCRALGLNERNVLAAELGVEVESLERLHVGWSARHRAYTFPMRDGEHDIRGIRLRSPDGRKWAVRGSRQGLFIPNGTQNLDLLLICEGPTDTAAMCDLGFEAVGRPSCSGGIGLVMGAIVPEHQAVPREVVIVADADGPGWRGAWWLASRVVAYVPAVRVISPPDGIKDGREWKRQGATRDDVLVAIDSAPVLQLRIAAQEML